MQTIDQGAQPISGREDLYRRTALLFDDLGMGGDFYQQFKQGIESQMPESEIHAWELETTRSSHTIPLIKRFSAVEGDTNNTGIKGQGRVSTAYPRMGGALSTAASKARVPSSRVIAAVELTVHAGYLASLLVLESIPTKPFRTNTEIVWEKWILEAYTVPSSGVEMIWEVVAFEEFWQRFLTQTGMKKPAQEFQKQKRSSPFVNSFSGLIGVGLALAAVEREET